MPWRPMRASDLPRVAVIAAEIHTAHPEDDAVLVERLRLYAAGCHVLNTRGALAAYTISHPWRRSSPPALNTMLKRIPANADTYYLHDMAIVEAARRAGAASEIRRSIGGTRESCGLCDDDPHLRQRYGLVLEQARLSHYRRSGAAPAASNLWQQCAVDAARAVGSMAPSLLAARMDEGSVAK